MFGGAPPCLACCSYIPQIEPESDDVAKAREIVKETTETRLKNNLAQKILGCHRVKLEVGAFVSGKKEMFERGISGKLQTK